MGINRTGLLLTLGILLAVPALAGDVVSNKFIITDEIFDFTLEEACFEQRIEHRLLRYELVPYGVAYRLC